MPGKVNPVIPEVVNQVAFRGHRQRRHRHDGRRGRAAPAQRVRADHLLLPVVGHRPPARRLIVLADALRRRHHRQRELLRAEVENSIGLVTALNPFIGYEAATEVAKEALATGRGVAELVLEKGLLPPAELERILKPRDARQPHAPQGEPQDG